MSYGLGHLEKRGAGPLCLLIASPADSSGIHVPATKAAYDSCECSCLPAIMRFVDILKLIAMFLLMVWVGAAVFNLDASGQRALCLVCGAIVALIARQLELKT